jgi:hypothetical protein
MMGVDKDRPDNPAEEGKMQTMISTRINVETAEMLVREIARTGKSKASIVEAALKFYLEASAKAQQEAPK